MIVLSVGGGGLGVNQDQTANFAINFLFPPPLKNHGNATTAQTEISPINDNAIFLSRPL